MDGEALPESPWRWAVDSGRTSSVLSAQHWSAEQALNGSGREVLHAKPPQPSASGRNVQSRCEATRI